MIKCLWMAKWCEPDSCLETVERTGMTGHDVGARNQLELAWRCWLFCIPSHIVIIAWYITIVDNIVVLTNRGISRY